MITNIEDYFTKGCGRCARFGTADCATQHWAQGLAALRQICLDAGLEEAVKWGHPCYMAAGQNIAIIGAFRGDFRLSFFNASWLADPQGVLEKQGAQSQHANMIRFTDAAQVAARGVVIRAFLHEAMGHAAAGRKPVKEAGDIVLPDELLEALGADPELAEAFHGLTPGRQKSYVINLKGTQVPATRRARIVKFRDKILSGKGALER